MVFLKLKINMRRSRERIEFTLSRILDYVMNLKMHILLLLYISMFKFQEVEVEATVDTVDMEEVSAFTYFQSEEWNCQYLRCVKIQAN